MCTSMRRPRPVSRLALALLVPVLGVACRSAARGAPEAHSDADRLRSDIAYLADDRLEGRGTGTAGNDSAASWLARRHASLGLRAVVLDTGAAGCSEGSTGTSCRVFIQAFMARSAEL